MKNGLEVYDFKEEDELVEFTAGKQMDKFKNPNRDDPAILKYEFLQCVSQGASVQKKGISSVLCVNLDAVSCDPGCNNESTISQPGPDREDVPITALKSTTGEQNELVDKNFDTEGNVNENSPTNLVSDAVDCSVSPDGQFSGHCIDDDSEPQDTDMAVVICPDYVVYRGSFHSGSLIAFTCNGIKIKDLSAGGDNETVTFERAIDDIIDIKCQWFPRVGSVIVKLHLLPKDAVQDGDACGSSGIEELKFAIVETNWSKKQDEIVSLSEKYIAVWNMELNEDTEIEGDSVGRAHYFPNFEEPFEDVVYPKGDADAVSISKRDVDLLHPETFINDTIIDFYIKYLKNQIQPEERNRFHFFNSFFFRKLADLDKDPSSISDGRAAFLRVRKWTRKVDIFGKDYVFIPVNYNLHWSLIVICHPGEVTTFKDGDLGNAEKVPCILHMDSIKGTHAGLKNLIQRYLFEEWKVRCKEASEDDSSKFLNLRFLPLQLPQQENSFDCGLFLLHYLELFLAEAPAGFNPFKLRRFSNFLNVDWFPPAEASLKRTLIQRLIFELLQKRHELKSGVSCDEPEPSKILGSKEDEMGIEIVSDKYTTSKGQDEKLSKSQGSQGTGIALYSPASMKHVQDVNGSNLGFREFFEHGATSGSLLAECQSFGQPSSFFPLNDTTISTRQHANEETGEEFVYMQSGETNYHEINSLTPRDGSIPDLSRGFETETLWNSGISLRAELSSSPESSNCSSDESDVEVIQSEPLEENAVKKQKEITDQLEPQLTVTIRCSTDNPASISKESVLKESTEPDKTENLFENKSLLAQENQAMSPAQENQSTSQAQENQATSPAQENQSTSQAQEGSSEEAKMVEKRDALDDEVQVLDNDHQAESCEQQAAKRLRLTLPPIEEEGNTEKESLLEDIHL